MDKIMQKGHWYFDKCPPAMKKALLGQIAGLEIRAIKKEEELREISDGTGPPGHSPTGLMIYTIRGYRPSRKAKKVKAKP